MATCQCGQSNPDGRETCMACYGKLTVTPHQANRGVADTAARNPIPPIANPLLTEVARHGRPRFVLSNFDEIHSRGQQSLDLELFDLPEKCHVEGIEFTSPSHAFHDIRLTPRKSGDTHHLSRIALLTNEGIRQGTHDLEFVVRLKPQGSDEEHHYEGLVGLPVLDLDQIRVLQKGRAYKSGDINVNLSGGGSLLDMRGAQVSAQAGPSAAPSHALTKRSFDGLLEFKAKVPLASHIAATLSPAAREPYARIRLFALKKTVLGRHLDENPMADILLEAPPGPRHADVLSRISREAAYVKWNGQRFDLEVAPQCKFGPAVDDARLNAQSPPHALKSGQTVRIPAIYPDDAVALEVLAATRQALYFQNKHSKEVFALIAPETKLAKTPIGWPANLPLFTHHQGRFWFHDTATDKETALNEGLPLPLGAMGNATVALRAYADLTLVGYTPGEYPKEKAEA